jgi:hypothetical protein
MAKTNSNFKLSKSTKRVLASNNFTNADQRNHYKNMMIEAELAASIPARTPRPRTEGGKE